VLARLATDRFLRTLLPDEVSGGLSKQRQRRREAPDLYKSLQLDLYNSTFTTRPLQIGRLGLAHAKPMRWIDFWINSLYRLKFHRHGTPKS
jgi:hypothetical protein